MYVETDFILALLKDSDWLKNNAEKIYEEEREKLWTSRYTLIELLVVSDREDWNPMKIISGANQLVRVEGDVEDIKAASSHMEENNFTAFDALHLIASGEDKIVSSDKDYDEHSERLKLEERGEAE
jgi:hypothetical protein